MFSSERAADSINQTTLHRCVGGEGGSPSCIRLWRGIVYHATDTSGGLGNKPSVGQLISCAGQPVSQPVNVIFRSSPNSIRRHSNPQYHPMSYTPSVEEIRNEKADQMIEIRGSRKVKSSSFILPGEVRAKKPSLTLNLGTKGLKGDFRTTTNGRADGLLARTGSLSGHPSKQQPRSTLLD
ncbi:hypothetical protein J6590_063936 [Homalodisca vitripennis]|nr:hypothetical protein J6590_063936 [Homalodisca vitripennis]